MGANVNPSDTNDVIGEYEEDYLQHPITLKIIAAFDEGKFKAIPEAKGLRKNNFTFSHPIFRLSSPDPQSQSPRNSPAIPVAPQFRIEQI